MFPWQHLPPEFLSWQLVSYREEPVPGEQRKGLMNVPSCPALVQPHAGHGATALSLLVPVDSGYQTSSP